MVNNIQGLQYLRALAAIMVALYHFSPLISPTIDLGVGGKGVDIFFVISGFVIAHAHRKDMFSPSGSRLSVWGQFMLKRLIRIVPLYWLTLCCTLTLHTIRGTPFSPPWKDFLFIPQLNALGGIYIYPAFVPGWTINSEMFFYLLFSLAVAWPRLRYAVVALLCALVTTGQWVHFDLDNVVGRFYTHVTLLGFVLGMALEQCYHLGQKSGWRMPPWLGWGLLIGGFVGLWAVRNQIDTVWPSCWALFIVTGAIYALQSVHSVLGHQLGEATYAIYLFHLYAMPIARGVFRLTGIDDETGTLWVIVRMIGCVVIICASGWAVHRWIERPVLAFLRRRLLPPAAPQASTA